MAKLLRQISTDGIIILLVKFDIQSSRAELPLYFCMDNFTVDISFERKS